LDLIEGLNGYFFEQGDFRPPPALSLEVSGKGYYHVVLSSLNSYLHIVLLSFCFLNILSPPDPSLTSSKITPFLLSPEESFFFLINLFAVSS